MKYFFILFTTVCCYGQSVPAKTNLNLPRITFTIQQAKGLKYAIDQFNGEWTNKINEATGTNNTALNHEQYAELQLKILASQYYVQRENNRNQRQQLLSLFNGADDDEQETVLEMVVALLKATPAARTNALIELRK